MTPALLWLMTVQAFPAGEGDPDYARDVRPILARYCFKCHGPDDQARKGRLRLDLRKDATRARKDGTRPINPGKPEESEAIRRIFSHDEGQVMPAPEANNPLPEKHKHTLRRWIAAGAEYTPHWAFLPPRPAPPPPVKTARWVRNPLDIFVLSRLEAAGRAPSPEADPPTLLRRVSLDLIGLPPTPEETEAFLADTSPDAYEKLVDRLLASPHYGERWARRWLDLARYADTNGYEKDRPRSIWPYRDWVIRALNADMPFDQFTIEQVAGDMLPGATPEQRIATGFHRNTMLNEEGGIDPLEFRFHAVVDRVATTGKAWLGLTLGCAQCHTHKFDPVTHREYYQIMAFLNNADEPEMDVAPPDAPARRAEIERKIAALEAELPNRFPAESVRWQTLAPASATSQAGVAIEILDDRSIRGGGGVAPDRDVLTVTAEAEEAEFIRLEVLKDPALPSGGPGRAPNGNFVLSELELSARENIRLVEPRADFSQDKFPVAHAVDGDPKTGWAIAPKTDSPHSATFKLHKPVRGATRLTFTLRQNYGQQHVLGRLRLSAGVRAPEERPAERRFREWLREEAARAVRWRILKPAEATSNLPLLTPLDDGSVLASGDQSKSDTYSLKFRGDLDGVTALRLEALPDERLPKHGPGRVYYEGPAGDFMLSELTATAGGKAVRFVKATHTFAADKFPASASIDGDPQSGWSINGGQGRPHAAVFLLESPLAARELHVQMLFERYYAAGLGRFRIWATSDRKPVEARPFPPDVESLLLRPDGQEKRLFEAFIQSAPELAAARKEIGELRRRLASPTTTLVMAERPPQNPRPTHLHKRGEFLQPAFKVKPGLPSFLPPLPAGEPPHRLAFARWLVSPENPLTARVTVNRHWSAFFGRGIVRTVDDFGHQGEVPSHPELLDWLALDFIRQGWSSKKLHRQIVTSAAYRQSSRMTPGDPDNRLLGRAPRVRLDAETIRDAALRNAGLLSTRIGGPSVFPPQPASVTTEGAYGQLAWKASAGEDRYRRGLYTYMKRTTPYAMFSTFDGPSGEVCVAQREISNTPLQALTLLNDTVLIEAAQALGKLMARRDGTVEARVNYLFRRCLTREPGEAERGAMARFFRAQRERFDRGELDAAKFAGEASGEAAAWAALARVIFNLDEWVVRG